MEWIPGSRLSSSFNRIVKGSEQSAGGRGRIGIGRTTRFGAALRVTLTAALLANLLDAVTTWIAITRFEGREVGILGWWVVRTWGLGPAIVLLKGGAVLLIVAVAMVGTEGQPRWWRAAPHQRWVVLTALTAATLWFGCLATRNAFGAWMVYRTIGR